MSCQGEKENFEYIISDGQDPSGNPVYIHSAFISEAFKKKYLGSKTLFKAKLRALKKKYDLSDSNYWMDCFYDESHRILIGSIPIEETGVRGHTFYYGILIPAYFFEKPGRIDVVIKIEKVLNKYSIYKFLNSNLEKVHIPFHHYICNMYNKNSKSYLIKKNDEEFQVEELAVEIKNDVSKIKKDTKGLPRNRKAQNRMDTKITGVRFKKKIFIVPVVFLCLVFLFNAFRDQQASNDSGKENLERSIRLLIYNLPGHQKESPKDELENIKYVGEKNDNLLDSLCKNEREAILKIAKNEKYKYLWKPPKIRTKRRKNDCTTPMDVDIYGYKTFKEICVFHHSGQANAISIQKIDVNSMDSLNDVFKSNNHNLSAILLLGKKQAAMKSKAIAIAKEQVKNKETIQKKFVKNKESIQEKPPKKNNIIQREKIFQGGK